MKNFPSLPRAVFAAFFLSLVFWALRFHGKLPAITDVFLFNYPCYSANLQEWAKKRVPLWDPATGCGTPQLANCQSAVAYPPFWIWNLTGLSHWMVWLSLLHSGFAFLGFYLWARSQKIFPLWAALGALSFAGSLHMVRCWGYPAFCASQSWTPWVFWAAARWLEGGRPRWWAALAFSVALQLLGGYPFFSFYTLLFLLIWLFSLPLPFHKKATLVLAVPAAMGIAAVQLIPFLDCLSYSTRGGWGSPDQFPYFNKLQEYLTLFSPTALGQPETGSYQGTVANANFMLYFGLVPLIVWVLCGLGRKFEGRAFWGLAPLAWLIWMLGFRFPVWRILPEPLLETLNPSKAVGVFLFTACTCVGLALTRFFRDWPEGEWKRIVFAGIAGLWALDVLCIPLRILHPVPDPFRKPALGDWMGRVRQDAQGNRVIGFRAKGQDVVTGGETDVFEKAADEWVENLLANSQVVWGLRGSQAYLALWTSSMDKLWKAFNKVETFQGALPDVVGVKALFLPVSLPAPHYKELETQRGNYLLENESCLGDAWKTQAAQTWAGQDEILAALSQNPPGVKNGSEVWLENVEVPAAGRSLGLQEAGKAGGFSRDSGSRASYQGDFNGNGWLVWNEAFTPGWKAWLDGKPLPIQRAFGFFMAVPVGSGGVHRVDFRYEPGSFRLGLFVTFLFLGIGLAKLGLFLGEMDEIRPQPLGKPVE